MSYLVDMPGLSMFLQIRAAKLLVFNSVSCSSVNLNKKIKDHFIKKNITTLGKKIFKKKTLANAVPAKMQPFSEF